MRATARLNDWPLRFSSSFTTSQPPTHALLNELFEAGCRIGTEGEEELEKPLDDVLLLLLKEIDRARRSYGQETALVAAWKDLRKQVTQAVTK